MPPYLTLMREDVPQREYALREFFNAVRYVVKTGCQWWFLPHDFPPWTAVDQQARRWNEVRDIAEEAVSSLDPKEQAKVHVITRYRDPNANLRTRFERSIARAGLKPWPKLFQNLRATRATELAGKFPSQRTGWGIQLWSLKSTTGGPLTLTSRRPRRPKRCTIRCSQSPYRAEYTSSRTNVEPLLREHRRIRCKSVRPEGFEPPTPRFEAWCSIQLSYGRAGDVSRSYTQPNRPQSG